ncbi:Macrophage infectivity potentiator-related protein [Acidisarcina polymorpha]|uniref:Macrophage infectivity potentiator-related protein n=1 Tax=Acidisarcina polymorpha TaxID=2211140 RepID=A0A2Z5G4N4_9BACT|nr:carboxymuconolactone decarboxylase family protein [Acidisarcina polymorpha]AXC13930.1 Macrophage infectivity potentiator-related protein [Acidisarcina polymorpha]
MSSQGLEQTDTGFSIYTIENAPSETKPLLEGIKKTYGGFLPNLIAVLGGSAPLLAANVALFEQVEKISLSAIEQQVVELAISNQNNCEYCVAGHVFLSRKLPQEPLIAARSGKSIAEPKLESLRSFAVEMVRTAGSPAADVRDSFFAHYSRQQALEVILLLTLKTLHNYTNNLAETPIDEIYK